MVKDLKFEDLIFEIDNAILGFKAEQGVIHLVCRMKFQNGEKISIVKGEITNNLWQVFSGFGVNEIGDIFCKSPKSYRDIIRFDTEEKLMSFVNKIKNYVGTKKSISATAPFSKMYRSI